MDQYTPDAVSTDKTKGEFYRTHVHRAGLPFLTAGVYYYECNATKPYNAVIGNMGRFVNRGLKHLLRPQRATKGIVKCFNEAEKEPWNQLRISSECAASNLH